MKELIELAKEIGFKSDGIDIDYFYNTSKKLQDKNSAIEIPIYLWMCELQKWLRDIHQLELEVSSIREIKVIYRFGIVSHPKELYSIRWQFDGDTYEQALQQGLIEALKLI